MDYAIWAKGPTLGTVRSFSTDRRKEKRKRARREHPTKLAEAAVCCLNGLDIEGADMWGII